MEPIDEHRTNDEFGYQRFALTEAAYDLVNKLTAIYSRLSIRAAKGELLVSENFAAKADGLQAGLYDPFWSEVSQLQTFVDQLSAEYKRIVRIESGQSIPNAAKPKRVQII